MAIYDAITSVPGSSKFSEAGPGHRKFTPHVSAAYVNREGPAEPITRAVSTVDPPPVTATCGTISLLDFHRDRRMYEWGQATSLPISQGDVS